MTEALHAILKGYLDKSSWKTLNEMVETVFVPAMEQIASDSWDEGQKIGLAGFSESSKTSVYAKADYMNNLFN